jgi:hypothetical protein
MAHSRPNLSNAAATTWPFELRQYQGWTASDEARVAQRWKRSIDLDGEACG